MSLLNSIICPITHQIFYNPVTIDDGYTYEKQAIEKWLENNKTSPMTKRNIITNQFTTNIVIRTFVENYMLENPDKKDEQYKEEVIKNNFVWDDFNKLTIPKQKEYLDNCIDLECKDNKGWKPIHLICKFSTPEMIKYIIDKNVDLEYEGKKGWKPIHLICRFSTPVMIKYIIDKNVDLECVTNDGWKPIHFICRYSSPKIIKYIIDKNVELECVTNDGWKPIHLICRYSSPKIIKYIIDKNVELECVTNEGWKLIHFICRYQTSDIISYALANFDTTKKCLIYDCNPVNYSVYDLINLNPLVTDKTLFKP